MRGVLAGADTRVDAVMIGTTHFVNAVVQRRSLAKVAVLRVALPATAGLPPFTDWPDDLAACADGGSWLVEGGHDYDGRRFMPLDVAAVRAAAREMRARGLTQAAVTAMFSPLTDADEAQVAAILREEVPGISVTCSHTLGGIGLLERENAAVLNAAIVPLARDTISGFDPRHARCGHQRAALHHAERRHRRRGRTSGESAGVQLRLRSDEFDARRGLSVAAAECGGGRCRRHHHRFRPFAGRLPAPGQHGGAGRRRADVVPHAGCAVDRPGRRQPARSCDIVDRPAQCRLPPDARRRWCSAGRN